MEPKTTDYRWPDLSPVARQYVIVDDHGRYGIATLTDTDNKIVAHPISVAAEMSARPEDGLPGNAIVMTRTVWHLQADGRYRGVWFDQNEASYITIISDLGIRMPDRWAQIALSGSDERGHWDYGATLGKVGGNPPVKGQHHNEMTVKQALDYANEVGEVVTGRGIRKAARSGYIPGARKLGRDWLIPYEGFNTYLDNRPKRGPKPNNTPF